MNFINAIFCVNFKCCCFLVSILNRGHWQVGWAWLVCSRLANLWTWVEKNILGKIYFYFEFLPGTQGIRKTLQYSIWWCKMMAMIGRKSESKSQCNMFMYFHPPFTWKFQKLATDQAINRRINTLQLELDQSKYAQLPLCYCSISSFLLMYVHCMYSVHLLFLRWFHLFEWIFNTFYIKSN